jgi:2-dehydro-3-deoxyphosphogluconate aldolase/(4S)-4-hydroxy-2-oxoglutarate aldolase
LTDDSMPEDRAEALVAALAVDRVLAIVRTSQTEDARHAAADLVDAGLRVVEVSLTTPGAWEVVEWLVGYAPPEVVVGVGTVLTADAARRAARCGAAFLVSPVLDTEVLTVGRDCGLAVVPGCATPSEMWRAIRCGATAVKIFPASTWTPRALADLLTPLPDLPCVPTGGVADDDVPAWLAAGALAVGLGSSLTDGDSATAHQRVRQLREQTAAAGVWRGPRQETTDGAP